MVAQEVVLTNAGVPADSTYILTAWEGDGADSLIEFLSNESEVVAISTYGGSFSESSEGTGTVVPGAIGAACTFYTAPGDLSFLQPATCQVQSARDAFSVQMQNGDGPAITLPTQNVSGIRVEVPEV